MLIEQAFMSLPEIMVGAGYARQDYEAGVVSALSMAILQELNGRNINKPISCICAERKYLDDRALRADLHVNLSRTFSGSAELSNFGFRFSNWMEAKYFRKTNGTPPSTTNLGAIAADLLRLMVLPPLETGKKNSNPNKSITGRYLLHVYRGDPLSYINPKRKAKGASPRKWPEKLLIAGPAKIESLEFDQEGSTFLSQIGTGLKKTDCTIDVTNIVLAPAIEPSGDWLTAVLTRIDRFSLDFEGRKVELKEDRTIAIKGFSALDELREIFAKELKRKKSSEESDAPDIGDAVVREEDGEVDD